MDLFSELQQAETPETVKGAKIEQLKDPKNYQDFARVLIDSSSNVTNRQHHKPTTITYDDEYLITGLPENTSTPFSNATGTTNKKTVVISKAISSIKQDTNVSSNPAPLGEEDMAQGRLPFITRHQRSVTVSNSIKQKAVYMTQDRPFVSEEPTSLSLIDLGAHPLSTSETRYLCSMYMLCCRDDDFLPDLPDLWILCQGKITCMGCCLDENNRKISVYKIIDGHTIKVPDSDKYSISLDSDTFNNSRLSHKRFQSSKTTHKVVTSSYNFGPTTSISDDSLLLDSLSKGACVSLDFIWSGRDACFSSPPTIADTVINVSVTPGYGMSPVLAVFSEVTRLLELCKISTSGEFWESNSDLEDEDVLECAKVDSLSGRVKSFLEDASSQMLKSLEASVISPTAGMSPFQPREDLDFLDQLWIFLRRVSSAEDLLECFGVIFKAIVVGRIQPFIHISKSSTLAILFRQWLSSRTSDERQVVASKLQCLLTEEKALACLMEIGIEKLQEDFVAFFSLNDLTTTSELDAFFDFSELQDQCHGLCCLQYVLELAAILSTFVALPLPSLSLFVRDALKYYLEFQFEEFTSSPIFKLHFPPMSAGSKTLISLASSLKPASWSVTEDRSDPLALCRRRMFCLENPMFQYLPPSSSLTTEDTVLYLYNVEHQCIEL